MVSLQRQISSVAQRQTQHTVFLTALRQVLVWTYGYISPNTDNEGRRFRDLAALGVMLAAMLNHDLIVQFACCVCSIRMQHTLRQVRTREK